MRLGKFVEQFGGLAAPFRWRYRGRFLRLCTGAGELSPGTNPRVAAAPFRRWPTVKNPAAIASATHRRPAASKARRQAGRQNTCRLPPSRRGANAFPHHTQIEASASVMGYSPPGEPERLQGGGRLAAPPLDEGEQAVELVEMRAVAVR